MLCIQCMHYQHGAAVSRPDLRICGLLPCGHVRTPFYVEDRAPRNVERQGFVKTLRQLGRVCGVPDLPADNNASQARVRELVRCILAHAELTEEQRVAAVAAHQGYEGTFAVQTAPDPEAEAEDEGSTVWQFKAAQLTYNSTTGSGRQRTRWH